MVTAEVTLYGSLKNVAGMRRVTVSLPPEFGLHDLVDALVAHFGAEVRPKLVASHGYIHNYVKIFVADRETRGSPDERFGPFPAGTTQISVYIIPMSEGGAGR